jgi:hypothetical protein
MPRCPKCGSENVRDSYITDCSRFIGELTGEIGGHVLGAIFGEHIARGLGRAAGETGAKVGESVWNRCVCEDCGCSWGKEPEPESGTDSTTSRASDPTSFSNPRQKKFYKELLPLSKEKGGFTSSDIKMIKSRSKDYGLNQSELHQVAAACWWKNGQKPSINDFSNT